MHNAVTRDISYASSAKTRNGRAVIRMVENMTGRVGLIRRAAGYEREVAAGRDFWQVMPARYGISLDIFRGCLDDIPRSGPLILVANHPYGILDGLIMGQILSGLRGDFRILAHRVFRRAEAIGKVILPISFDETEEATRLNLETRSRALSYLSEGGAIGVFPGGTVSTAATPFAQAYDPVWRNFTARMVTKSGATVVPIYFEGQNSRLFQIASHLHSTLRMALLIREFRARLDEPVRLAIGAPIAAGEIAARRGDPRGLMTYLRQQTYALAGKPDGVDRFGYEFEERYRT